MDEDARLAELAQRTPSPEPDGDFFADFEPRGLLEDDDEPAPPAAQTVVSPLHPRFSPGRGGQGILPRVGEDQDDLVFEERDFLDDDNADFFRDNTKMEELLAQTHKNYSGMADTQPAAVSRSTSSAGPPASVHSGPSDVASSHLGRSVGGPDTRHDADVAAALTREVDASERDLGNALAQLDATALGGDGHASGSSAAIPPLPPVAEQASFPPYSFQFGRRDERGLPKYMPVASSVTFTFDGTEVRIPRRRRMKGWRSPTIHYDLDAGDGKIDARTGGLQLTARPVYEMLDDLKRRKLQAVRHVGVEPGPGRQRAALQGVQVGEQAVPPSEAAPSAEVQLAEAHARSQLWVDKHRPSTFTQLLGDERVHRMVLGWIKAWDPCVFKTTPPTPEANPNAPWEKPDPLHRPREKVLLLSGPAGAGKTTLAHVLAKQAGYDVYEMNASDARAASSVDETLRQALDTGSSIRGKKPTLVVLDEIDGATGGSGDGASFIRSLVRLIERGSAVPRTKKKTKKGASTQMVLQRPIICICNNLYAPALRALRPIAKIVRVPVPPSKTVVQRLRHISTMEGLPTDNKGLSLLTDLTGGDLRACLNALQVLAVQHAQQLLPPSDDRISQRVHPGITEESLRGAALGFKDGGSNLPRVWDILLRSRKSRKLRELSAAAPVEPGTVSRGQDQGWLMGVVHELDLSGEYDAINAGLASAWPSFLATAKDDGWGRAVRALDWLAFGETLSLSTRAGSFDMLPYAPFAIAPWHGLFAHHRIALPGYPSQDMEARQRSLAFQEIAQATQESLPSHLRGTFDTTRVATELGPMLYKIINPMIRPVNSQVTVKSEQAAAQHAVDVMLSLGIQLVADRNEAGHTVYRTQPPLDEFVEGLEEDLAVLREASDSAAAGTAARGSGVKGASGGSNFAVRHYLAREVAKAAHIKAEQAKAAALAANGDARAHGAHLTKNFLSGGQAGQEVPMGLEKAPVAKDFFGRPLLEKTASAPHASESDQGENPAVNEAAGLDEPAAKRFRPHPKVTFRFNEGFSNAVRKSIRLQDLL